MSHMSRETDKEFSSFINFGSGSKIFYPKKLHDIKIKIGSRTEDWTYLDDRKNPS